MTNAKFNFLNRTLAAGAVLAGAMLAGQSAVACTLDNWSSSSGAVTAGDPLPNPPSSDPVIPRYSGFCGMQVSGLGYVQDDNPGNIDRIVARFYVLRPSSGTVEVYAGYGESNGTVELFNVTVDSSGQVILTDTDTGQTATQTGSTQWLSVEIDWIQDASNGRVSLLVNGGESDGGNPDLNEGFGNDIGNELTSVRLGNLDGAAVGTIGFDAYESRRSTGVGRLLAADANDNGIVNIADASAIVAELNQTLQSGQPDCNENGVVNLTDASCVIAQL